MQKALPAVNMGTGPRIMLASGSWFDLLDPWTSEFCIEDIAQALGNICRYAGHCSRFYSVAEHSLHVSGMAASNKLEALMHDAAEAFLGDVTRPLKQLLPQYKRIEANVEKAIFARFGLDHSCLASLKLIDLSVLAAEQEQIMPSGTDYWTAETGVAPAPITVRFLSPNAARNEFLKTFNTLRRNARAASGLTASSLLRPIKKDAPCRT
jgi:hypothetical protein